jgi:putative endonuclease
MANSPRNQDRRKLWKLRTSHHPTPHFSRPRAVIKSSSPRKGKLFRVGSVFGLGTRMPGPKRFVYILKSVNEPDEYYVGLTSDPEARLQAHNAGLSPHTEEHRPWRTLVRVEFDEEAPAMEFERYLKTGSGREFARRHFRQTVRRKDRNSCGSSRRRQAGHKKIVL